jgi:hypothetical protein
MLELCAQKDGIIVHGELDTKEKIGTATSEDGRRSSRMSELPRQERSKEVQKLECE